ncbi:MAG: hypothetical protein JXB85_18270 [Anaerolineales bacterium]|nr:hypothetical protein [Anaerolineales bacterium]
MRFDWRKAILFIAIFLFLASAAAYFDRAADMTALVQAWPDYSESEKQQAIQEYGLEGSLAAQQGLFLALFSPALALVTVYGLSGLSMAPVRHSPTTQLILALALVTNLSTILISPLRGPHPLLEGYFPQWFALSMAVLGLAGYICSLLVWNGRKWGLYGLVISMGLVAGLNLVGGVPLVNALFGFTLVIILWVFLRPVWWQMN